MSLFEGVSGKLLAGEALTIVLLNDTGFVAGAGVALKRQAQSFLLGGHRTAVVCWLDNPQIQPPHSIGRAQKGDWLGLHSVPHLHCEAGLSGEALIEQIVAKVRSFDPDLVVCGNLHWAKWPLDLMPALNASGMPVVAYLHDCHWVTGRCAQPESCTQYLTGCDATCPTPTIYPSLHPDLIAGAWRHRREVFTGETGIPLAANSFWMQGLARNGFHGRARVALLPLGLDHELFAPIDQGLARRLLGLPEDGFYAIFGATDVASEAKGVTTYRRLGLRLDGRKDLRLLAFGHNSEHLPGVHGFGNVVDERIMPVLYSAADVIISASRAESFGQTLMEAAACGRPMVTIAAGGVVDIAREGCNAITLQSDADDGQFLDVLERLAANPALGHEMGRAGRSLVETSYTLETQYRHWHDYLVGFADPDR